MALKADHSDLPKAQRSDGATGLLPDDEPRFVQALVEHWRDEDEAHPHVRGSDARFWHSDAGKCSRLIAYKAAGIPSSDPMDLSGLNNVRLGQIIHEQWQDALVKRLGDVVSVEERVFTLDGDGTGRVDATIRADKTTSIEAKSIGGFGYKAAIGKASRGRAAEGPKSEHLLQGALNGLAQEADEVVVAYLSKEAVSVNMARGISEVTRFAAEWTFTREQFAPRAEVELRRVKGILDLVDEGTLAARKMIDLPPKAEIVDPSTGRWEQREADGMILDTGSHWSCGYCSHRTLCAQTPSGRIATEQAVAISTKAVA